MSKAKRKKIEEENRIKNQNKIRSQGIIILEKKKGICICKCEKCGGIFKNKYSNLKNTPKCKLCSSGKSLGEIRVSDMLIHFNIKFDTEKAFKGLKGIGGGKLRYDFIVFKKDKYFIIEVDGDQHRKESSFFTGNTKEHDKIKNEFCKDNNIQLYRLKYTGNIKRLEEQLLEVLVEAKMIKRV